MSRFRSSAKNCAKCHSACKIDPPYCLTWGCYFRLTDIAPADGASEVSSMIGGSEGLGASRSAHHTQRRPRSRDPGRCHTLGHARYDRLSCFASERLQQALHNGVLRRPELFGAALGEATEDGQRGQTRLSREPALDVGEVRIEHRWLSHALFVWLAHAPMDDALLP